MTTLLLTLASLATLGAAGQGEANSPSTAEVARKYVQLQFQERDLACFDLLADGVRFIDPTAAFLGDGPTVRGVAGKAEFRALHDSWSIEASRFDVQHFLVMGDFAITAGRLSWMPRGRSWVEEVPFTTVLRVEDGAITSRRDYGAYDQLGPQPVPGKADLLLAADAYLEAYAALDVEAVGAMLAENAVLVDPTLGADEAPAASREELLAGLAEARARGVSVRFDIGYRLACGQQALFLGEGHMSYPGDPGDQGDTGEAVPAGLSYPCLIVLTFEDGAVVEHRRYADHAGLRERLQEEDS